MSTDMEQYYEERAPVYDRVYAYEERQEDLRTLEQKVQQYFAGKHVLEVAAGTGYWSQFICRTATGLLATDVNPGPLQVLQERKLEKPVDTLVADGYTLEEVKETFEAGFAGCWISHIPIAERTAWFERFHAKLEIGSKVLLLDNSEAQTVRLPIIDRDDDGNTYQERVTDAGDAYRVVKNFPDAEELKVLVDDPHAVFTMMDHYWSFEYTVV